MTSQRMNWQRVVRAATRTHDRANSRSFERRSAGRRWAGPRYAGVFGRSWKSTVAKAFALFAVYLVVLFITMSGVFLYAALQL